MATGRQRIAHGKVTYMLPDRTVVFNDGDSIPQLVELYGVAESLEGGPVFEGTDVPIEYLHYYLDKIHNLYAFLNDYPSVTLEQAFAAIEERLREDLLNVINSDKLYQSGTPRFNGTRMTVYTMFNHLASGEDIDTFLSHYATWVTPEQCAELLQVAKRLAEFYAYKIAHERMGDGR